MANLLAASRTDSTLTPSCLQQLWCFDILLLSCKEQDHTCTYSCSRSWFGAEMHRRLCCWRQLESSTWTWRRWQSRRTSGSPAGHSALAWDTHPVRLHQAPDNGWNHGCAPEPPRGRASIQVKPIKTSPAINNPQLSVQENQLLHHLKCSTCTYMKILKGSFKRYAEERGGAGEAERCPEKEPTAVFVSLPLPVAFHKQCLGEKASINVNNCSLLHDPWPICKLTQFLNYICL